MWTEPTIPTGNGVYIIGEVDRTDRRIKVGKTSVGGGRIVGVGRQCPGPLEVLWWWPATTIKVAHRREMYLHRRWSGLRVHGEWFLDDGELAQFVRSPFSLSDQPPCPTCGGYVKPAWLAPTDTTCESKRPVRCQGLSSNKARQCDANSINAEIFEYMHKGSAWRRCERCWYKLDDHLGYIENRFTTEVIRLIESNSLEPVLRSCSRFHGPSHRHTDPLTLVTA